MVTEIKLIREVQKHDCIYNHNVPEYNRKDLTDVAWAEIAENTNMSVGYCKVRWRHIRTAFLRSLKPSEKMKIKRPYQFSKYLQFLVPYMKTVNMDNSMVGHFKVEQEQGTDNNDPYELFVNIIKEEPMNEEIEGENNDNHQENNDDRHHSSSDEKDILTLKQRHSRKRHKLNPARKYKLESDASRIRCKSPSEMVSTANKNNATKMFLMSLLPELETLTEDQVRLFKIKALTLIDEIKVNPVEARQNTTLNNERLQKRLINLLLRNLEKGNKHKNVST